MMLIQLGAALLITGLLAFLARYHGYSAGYRHGLDDGRGESVGLARQQAHEEGLYEGRLKERLEWETKEYKARRDYDTGYADCLEDMQRLNNQAMVADGQTTQLSA